jgi:hypothetical protein
MNPMDLLILAVTWGLAAWLATGHGGTPAGVGQAVLLFAGGAWHTSMQWLRHQSWLRHRASGTQHLLVLGIAGLGICLACAAVLAALSGGPH